MKILYSWLKELLPLKETPEEIGKLLTSAGLEVESIEAFVPSFTNVVVAEVLLVSPHPDAERLKIARVTDGVEEYQVVCGASNCRPGMRTALARLEATLQGADGKKFTIKASKLRGIESFGMLCSLDELGLSSQEEEGIVEWENHFPIGTDLQDLLTDYIFDISLTPNLGHCFSVLGVARELSALTGVRLHFPKHDVKTVSDTGSMTAQVLSKAECPIYQTLSIDHIKTGKTPFWMKQRLETSGIRCISLLVDISNYVLLELGQPLHFFDREKISGDCLTVQLLDKPVSLELLNETTLEIPSGVLVIADREKPLALAGIMGGESSAVSAETSSIVIEAAQFSPSLIRKTAKSLDLRSESSMRFERGVDPLNVETALERAAYLVQTLCSEARVHKPVATISSPYTPKTIPCRINRINALLGTHLSGAEIGTFLVRLGMSIESETEKQLTLRVPSYRNDLKEEIDLVEEIAKMHGFENLFSQAKFAASRLPDHPLYGLEKRLKASLYSQGLQEFLTCDLISPRLSTLTEEITLPSNSAIRVLHPRSLDQSVLRMSLLPGLLTALQHNLNQKNNNIRAFEIGKVHFQMENHFYEHSSLGIILCGLQRPYHFDPKPLEVDFLDLKGIIENIFSLIHLENFEIKPSHLRTFHPGRQAKIFKNEQLLGVMGEIHPEKLQPFGIDTPVYYAELSLLEILKGETQEIKVQQLPVFPGSDRDWTLIVQEEISIDELVDAIKKNSSSLLREIVLLDIYKNKTIGTSCKSVTFRFHYLDERKTLSSEEVKKEHERVTVEVAKKFSLSL